MVRVMVMVMVRVMVRVKVMVMHRAGPPDGPHHVLRPEPEGLQPEHCQG